MFLDLKNALIQLKKRPWSSLLIALVLACGIGANTAAYSVFYQFLARGITKVQPEQLVLIGATGVKDIPGRFELFSYPTFSALREKVRSISQVAAVAAADLSVSINPSVSESTEFHAEQVSGNYFRTLGINAAVGRLLDEIDDTSNGTAENNVVLSYSCWKQYFGGDNDVVGKTLQIERVPFTIIGVVEEDFQGVFAGERCGLWICINSTPSIASENLEKIRNPRSLWLRLFGRLNKGFSSEKAGAEIDLWFQQELTTQGIFNSPRWGNTKNFGRISIEDGANGFLADPQRLKGALVSVLASTICLLLLVCTNAGTLFYSRVAERWRDFAIKIALGCDRLSVIRQTLIESFSITLCGASISVLLAWAGARALLHMLPVHIESVPLDFHIWTYLQILTIIVAGGIGSAPAVKFSRSEIAMWLRAGPAALEGRTSQSSTILTVSVQLAIAICLLVTSSLFVRELVELQRINLGFQPERLLLIRCGFDKNAASTDKTSAALRLSAAITTIPGVVRSSFSAGGLLTESFQLTVSGGPAEVGSSKQVPANVVFAGPDYFPTIGSAVLSGRTFTTDDVNPPVGSPPQSSERVAIISHSLALHLFGKRDPLGHSIADAAQKTYRIIGIAPDIAYENIGQIKSPTIYLPYIYIEPANSKHLFLQVRTAVSPQAVIQPLREMLAQLHPGFPLRISEARAAVDAKLATPRLLAELSGLLSIFAVILAAAGLYGTLSFAVNRRKREIAVRMAIGATRVSILLMILRWSSSMVAAGASLGAGLTLFVIRILKTSVPISGNLDSFVVLTAAVPLVIATFTACFLPALLATRIAPAALFKAE